MQRKEVCAQCRLTKKALAYYEAKGLVHPAVLENGYREYSQADVARLKEIGVLRQCGVATEEIRPILESGDKQAALAKYRYVAGCRLRREEEIQRCLEELSQGYDIDKAFAHLEELAATLYTVGERLALAFPGGYGLFVALHFGRFLEGALDTEEKRQACRAVIGYLDEVELHLSPELVGTLEEAFPQGANMEELEQRTGEETQQLLQEPEAYLAQHREMLEEYMAYRLSEEFAQSPAGRLNQELRRFQAASGYQEVFLANMKRLSPAYAAYCQELEAANQVFLEQYPEAKHM